MKRAERVSDPPASPPSADWLVFSGSQRDATGGAAHARYGLLYTIICHRAMHLCACVVCQFVYVFLSHVDPAARDVTTAPATSRART